ncbi:efflux RND transporter permease subunit [Bittarella massiliensis]|uniref:efflux RND transporter permease subunit n=1 Tax=Bittarella massiliensis (ex Durand et al. 2017) TaxID=1720313 RepID=UPI00163C058E|nr:efflux RND transporter permease subunit [Bittarella massiliensis (ex Durand et al. 2017)]MBC2872429.1 efflux RND transporter permease subunit [Bittarella massiliensis (ex Durand et al. 2017)]
MLSKFSVKKPLTVFVAVILVMLMGVISFTNMQTDLLPSLDLPYVAVITAYPGASPEKVEQAVTKPLEKGLSTTSGIKEVQSISSENTSMVILQFADGTNMDSAMIDLSGKVDLVKGQLADGVSTPTLMKINPDMLPVMIAAVDADGQDAEALSQLVNETVLPALERVDGVASVSATGVLEKEIQVTLDQQKIDALNDKMLAQIDAKLAQTKAQLDQGEAQIKAAQEKLDSESAAQAKQLADSAAQLSDGKAQLSQGLSYLDTTIAQTKAQREQLLTLRQSLQAFLDGGEQAGPEAEAALTALVQRLQDTGVLTQQEAQALLTALTQQSGQLAQLLGEAVTKLDEGIAAADSGLRQMEAQRGPLADKLEALAPAETQLEAGKMLFAQKIAQAQGKLDATAQQLSQGRTQFEEAEKAAYQTAGLSGKLTPQTIQGILAAENFSMPAGSLTEKGEKYAVKVGDAFSSVEELAGLELFTVDLEGIGTIKLSDVAEVAFADNRDEMYAKINGNDGILLTFQKQSTASTSQVSADIRAAMAQLQEEHSGLHLTALNDQGVYIDIVVQSVLQNLLMGGALAILIILLFLRNYRPTLAIAASIPISLLFAVALMYFSGVTLNIISLAGLALGVGMLVDNSIVVIENIYRLRGEGMSAAQAAVRGAAQVAGAIAASTLTTVCVFLPIVFTQGISRELFTDMGLTIAYSLVASLIVALTLVPALSSKLLRRPDQTKHRLFDRFVNWYARLLDKALSHRAAVLCGVVALLVVSGIGATRMGTAFIPESDTNQISVTVEMPPETTTAETRAMGDRVAAIVGDLPGVETVGAMEGGGMMSSGGSGSVSMYVILSEGKRPDSSHIAQQIKDATAGLACEVTAQSSMGDMSSMGGSGLTVQIQGDDLDTLRRVGQEVAALMEETEGTQDVEDGSEDPAYELRVSVDKNKAMGYGLTVAQVYQEVAAAIQSETTATTLSLEDGDYPVVVVKDPEAALSRATLGDHQLTVTKDGEETAIPLSDIAQISQEEGLSSIRHDGQVRTLSVSAQIDAEHNIGLVSRELQSKLDGYQPPAGYTVELVGQTETINSTLVELLKMVGLAIVLIYGIMVAQFQSLLSPFIVMFTIPLAFTGGLLALWLCGMEISVISMLGFLVLCGVVVNNGIVFVDYVNQLRLEGAPLRQALVETGVTRVRPILMTALTTILGLGTLALGIGSGADMLQPMAVVTIGGLAYATLLTLFVVPILYDLFHRRKKGGERMPAGGEEVEL